MEADNEKMMDKIRKLFSLAESEKSIGNIGAAITIAEKARQLLVKYKIDFANLSQADQENESYSLPVMGVTTISNPFLRANARTNFRQSWWENLAEVVAEGYFCRISINIVNGNISFYGLDMDREIAIFVFEKLAEFENDLAKIEMKKAMQSVGAKVIGIGKKKAEGILDPPTSWIGDDAFLDSFHKGFREVIKEKYFAEDKDGKEISFDSVDKFRLEEMRSSYNGYETALIEKDHDINLWAVQIGERSGKFTTRKVGATDQKSATEQLMVVKKDVKENGGEVFVCLDVSGSISGDKLDQEKSGAMDYANSAKEKGFSVGLIEFGTEARKILDIQKNINGAFASSIDSITVGGRMAHSTNISDAINCAVRYFRNRRGKRVIFIATDGQPNGYDSQMKALATANDAKRQGIEIMAIGCDGADREFLEKLASRKGMGLLVDSSEFGSGIKKMAGFLNA